MTNVLRLTAVEAQRTVTTRWGPAYLQESVYICAHVHIEVILPRRQVTTALEGHWLLSVGHQHKTPCTAAFQGV